MRHGMSMLRAFPPGMFGLMAGRTSLAADEARRCLRAGPRGCILGKKMRGAKHGCEDSGQRSSERTAGLHGAILPRARPGGRKSLADSA
jgi:hypothetical protein